MKNRWGIEYTAKQVGMMSVYYFTSKRQAILFAKSAQGDWDIGRISRRGNVKTLERVSVARHA